MNLPNLMSLGRLLSVPLIVYLLVERSYEAAFWVFVAAGASDAIDGFLAKRLHQVSQLGSYLDPLADKTLIVAVYITLGGNGALPLWLVILVVSRDILIIGGTMVLLMVNGRVVVHPLFVSKINTAAQIALIVVVLAELGVALRFGIAQEALTYVVAATTLLSGGFYLAGWARQMTQAESRG